MKFGTVAVVGATGAVGRIIRDQLESRNFPADRFRFLATKRSAGSKITFRGEEITVEEVSPEAFAGCDLVIASTPDEASRDLLPHALKAGAVVIDESGYWRMNDEVALVIPEINPAAAYAAAAEGRMIASPNCSTTQMVQCLKPLHDAAGLTRVIVSTYQAVSGAGLSGTAELLESTKASMENGSFVASTFQRPIGFNLIPQIGSFKEQGGEGDGYTSEEMKMVRETRKILDLPGLLVNPTCVRVPVADCHSESIACEFERPLSVAEAREALAAFPGIAVMDDPVAGQYPTPLDCAGDDRTFVGRIRKDLSHPNGLSFWCVSDNLRKGAATNAVQIAELLAQN
ncbi:aspartate-semialdehyde dehydrogenase [Alienimonas chondri]|uniref:Aspartate-semialdehyde dehydrogenase n=1 Tax=Alienimonas chondri TaxID=2681879 RepID=A0ABX1VAH6_9PLAN|nr:aspartate-semialdehyde dehydrogenase [Alienimonas chondri]NNJ24441.1 Aspartate-semialdehyde dehydrogenase [Alienimonas chondri]